MQNFSSLIFTESEKSASTILKRDVTTYINKVGKKLPPLAKTAIEILVKYNIDTRAKVELVRNANKQQLKSIAGTLDMDAKDLVVLWNALVKLGRNVKLLPHYQTEDEREAVELGDVSIEDLTIDLETSRGRDAVTKQYLPIVLNLAKKYAGYTKMQYDDLISAGSEGLARAIATFKTRKQVEIEGLDKKVSKFSSYAYGMILNAIRDEMNKYGYDFSGTYAQAVANSDASELRAIQLDGLGGNGEDNGAYDRVLARAGEAGGRRGTEENKLWSEVFAAIEKKFSQRDCDIFYRALGLNGYEQEKSQEVAKSLGVSNATVTVVKQKITKFLASDPKLREVLRDIMDIYNESFIMDALDSTDKTRTSILQHILDAKAADDSYLLLEELTKWDDPKEFQRAYGFAINSLDEDGQLLIQQIVVGGYEEVDDAYKTHNDLLIQFLQYMYPVDDLRALTDVEVIEKMVAVQEAWRKSSEAVSESEETIKNEDDFRAAAKKKFETVFGDKLDKKRMEFTIDGILKNNEEDVKNGEWGKLIGKLNKSFGHA